MSEKVNKILYVILSLLLAIVFWLYVDDALDNTITREFKEIPIEFIGEEDTLPNRGLMLVDGEDATMDLTVTGPRTTVSNLRRSDIRAQVDLTNINAAGTYPRTYTFVTSNSINRADISIQGSRSTVTVQVVPMYSKQVPVGVNVVGEVAEGFIYMTDRLVAEPTVLTLSGKEEDVEQVESVRVVVDLSGANSTVQQDFVYEMLDSQGNVVQNEHIRVSDKRVRVTAPVYVIKELPLAVKFKQAAGSLETDTRWWLEHESITVAGEAASLETITEITMGEVDLTTILSDVDLPLEISIPAGCFNLSGISTTTLSIRFRGLETRAFSVSNISPIGLSSGQRFSLITNSVEVLLRGPAAELEKVSVDDIRIVVDLTQFESNGTYTVDAMIFVDGHDQVGAVGSAPSVACKITS